MKSLPEVSELRKRFSAGKPFKHVLVRSLINERFSELLLSDLKKERFKLKESDLFRFKQTDDLKFSKNKTLKSFHNLFSSKDFLNFISEITEEKLSGKVDMAGTLYENMDFLLPHDDQLEKRKVAYIYYLTNGFTEKDGGDLVFYNTKGKDPRKIVKSFIPSWNSLILFEVSPKSFHSVREILSDKKRYAIAGWFH